MSLNKLFKIVFNFGGKNIHIEYQVQKVLSNDYPKDVTLLGKDHRNKRYMGTGVLHEDGSINRVHFIKD